MGSSGNCRQGQGRRSAARALAAASLLATSGCGDAIPTAGFWFERQPFPLPAHTAEALGGPLTDTEMTAIAVISRAEVERAFSAFNIHIVADASGFWRVGVVPSLPPRGPLPNAGESTPLGFLGGAGAVSFELVADKATRYAPAGASRQTIVEGIGRGIGRVAVHEFAHQILNDASVHNKADEHSYEYPSPDRAAQYYGELRWTTARPSLARKLR